MTGEAQGMLFGAITSEHRQARDNEPRTGELRICALNVNNAGPARAQGLLEWLLDADCNILILSELPSGDGGQLILTGLEAEGFRGSRTGSHDDSRRMAAVATRGFEVTAVTPAPFSQRVAAIDVQSAQRTARIVGIYAPTNGMTAESSRKRRSFQDQLIGYLAAIGHPALCVAGDLNVVEPGHRPSLPNFEEHDYAFYTRLAGLGLRDAYRTLHPEGNDHSWISPQYGSQRLDHALISPGAGTIRQCRYDHSPRERRLTDHAALVITVSPDAGG